MFMDAKSTKCSSFVIFSGITLHSTALNPQHHMFWLQLGVKLVAHLSRKLEIPTVTSEADIHESGTLIFQYGCHLELSG